MAEETQTLQQVIKGIENLNPASQLPKQLVLAGFKAIEARLAALEKATRGGGSDEAGAKRYG
jgi:hypothetical protein